MVRISHLEDLIVYVWPVGGYLLEPKRVHAELQRFRTRLTQFGLCYYYHEYYIAIYDFIVRFHGRQNELWVLAKTCDNDNISPTELYNRADQEDWR